MDVQLGVPPDSTIFAPAPPIWLARDCPIYTLSNLLN